MSIPSLLPNFLVCSCSTSKPDPLLKSNGDTFLRINLNAEMHEHSVNPSAPLLVLENVCCDFPLIKIASLGKD